LLCEDCDIDEVFNVLVLALSCSGEKPIIVKVRTAYLLQLADLPRVNGYAQTTPRFVMLSRDPVIARSALEDSKPLVNMIQGLASL
jgi:hypothetical protein